MARLRQDTVDRLIELLSLPVGEQSDDARPSAMAGDVERVSQALGWLVFEDDRWFDYDARRIEDILDAWLDDTTAGQLDAVARDQQPPEFLSWVEQLVATWQSGEAGAQGPATEGGEAGPLGLANPYYEPNRIPGTEFYKYVGNEYLYAATDDAPAAEWRTLEARSDEYRAGTAPAEQGDGVLRGYPYLGSVLAGTEYYRLDGEVYLYGPKEFGTAAEWQPYEHWQARADEAEEARVLINELDSFIALIETRIREHR